MQLRTSIVQFLCLVLVLHYKHYHKIVMSYSSYWNFVIIFVIGHESFGPEDKNDDLLLLLLSMTSFFIGHLFYSYILIQCLFSLHTWLCHFISFQSIAMSEFSVGAWCVWFYQMVFHIQSSSLSWVVSFVVLQNIFLCTWFLFT